MATTDRITGKDLYVAFNDTNIGGDFTSVTFSEEGDLVDVTAGADSSHYYVPLERKDGECTVESFYAGTAVWTALAVNTVGTLTIAPKGTATGSPKYEWSRAIVKSRELSQPFDDGVTMSVSFQFSSAMTASSY